MSDPDPIRQLQHLLDDPGKVLEKISSIQSALGAVKAPKAETAASSVAPAAPSCPLPAVSTSEQQSFDRLLQTLRDMQTQIDERLRPLALQAVQSGVEDLRQQAERDQAALNDCLARIDRSIAICLERIEESQHRFDELRRLHRRLTELGAATESSAEDICAKNPSEIIHSRIESLRRAGKL